MGIRFSQSFISIYPKAIHRHKVCFFKRIKSIVFEIMQKLFIHILEEIYLFFSTYKQLEFCVKLAVKVKTKTITDILSLLKHNIHYSKLSNLAAKIQFIFTIYFTI